MDEQIDSIRDRDRQFTEWRQGKAREMPALAARVFALRGRGYDGSGFHWGLEKSLGAAIMLLNDYHTPGPGRDGYYNTPGAVMNQIALKVVVKSLEEQVAEIEAGLNSSADPALGK